MDIKFYKVLFKVDIFMIMVGVNTLREPKISENLRKSMSYLDFTSENREFRRFSEISKDLRFSLSFHLKIMVNKFENIII